MSNISINAQQYRTLVAAGIDVEEFLAGGNASKSRRARRLTRIGLGVVAIGIVTIPPAVAGTGTGAFSTIGGGNGNTASATYTTVGGGNANAATNLGATIGGGHSNLASGIYSTMAAGYDGEASGNYSSVGGGEANNATGSHSTVAGGWSNFVSAESATVGGGSENRVTDSYGSVGGGGDNQAGNGTNSLLDRIYATVAGGLSNSATGSYATVPGGYTNTARGDYSFAAGRQAKALELGSFVWGDSTAAFIKSTRPDQFVARASGGVTFFSNPKATTGVVLPPGGGSWSTLSDRTMKTNFVDVDGVAILERLVAMPIQLWNYKSQDPNVRHIGPMAQDFSAAFDVGESDTTISTVDADGVAFAAIQGLYQENQQLERDLEKLKGQVEKLLLVSTK